MRTTKRDEYKNADIIGIESTTLYDGLDFDETARLTFALNRLADYEDTGFEPQDLDVELEHSGKKVHLRRCPFCGSAPMIRSYRNRMKNWFRIRCSDEKEVCRMIPETSASRTLEEAAADWNMMPKEEAT